MQRPEPTEIWLIRHAPADAGGRLAGRRDVPLAALDPAVVARARAALAAFGSPARVVTSPARRCRDTASRLFPEAAATTDPRLWEQDFGAWDGADPASIPDLGPLPSAALADHAPPGGESFSQLVARTAPALADLAGPGPVAVVAHAGTVRAALTLALGTEGAGLAFSVAPLSLTRVTMLPGDTWAIGAVNLPL
ncbi:histidine phosphatase family protein [Frigidibacter sp. MR17.24]|uniref:histidine phosphatase family protein n=1 Tax=Frigidibacter sp. MR17.24 TaxID=3127345 RepID=UPI003012F0E6